MSSFAILGEALIDLRPAAHGYLAQPGGSPFNVAIGLARLGHRAEFVGRFAQDALSSILRRHAQRSGVSLEWSGEWSGPTPAAIFDLNEDGSARYEFHLGDARESLFAESASGAVDGVHFGSIASWMPGSGEPVLAAVARLKRAGVFVSYDPNIRGMLIRDKDDARRRVEQAVALADLIKASIEDLQWLYPESGVGDVARRWLAAGARSVVVTRGGQGADSYSGDGMLHGSGEPVEVVDTVGAGDAFMAALLDGLMGAGAGAVTQSVLDAACAYAAATCAVPGADPPWRSSIPARTA
ncbi:MAG TPA: carbohydrate kinase [Actinospica sp.]|nr:carbohydrate kinase [Actinospica sp.]